MGDILDAVLLLALPASGKSEVRRYLAQLSQNRRREDFHMGPTVQLDDFPYVHLMRCVDEELVRLGQERVFFRSAESPFKDPRDWGTLIRLVNEDYRDLRARSISRPEGGGAALLDRLDAAAAGVGAAPRLRGLGPRVFAELGKAMDAQAAALFEEKSRSMKDSLEGKTLVVEFARGGPRGSRLPLLPPFGYQHSLSLLDEDLLRRALVLYVWVTPEESRRKNRARANPADPGSILHHGVPEEVMLNDYGCDDIDWLEARAGRPGAVRVETATGSFLLPLARFDNREDKTSFLRAAPSQWSPEHIQTLHAALKAAFNGASQQLI